MGRSAGRFPAHVTVLVAVLAAVLPGCDGDSAPTPPTTTPPATSPPATTPPVTNRVIEVSSTDVPKDIPNLTTITSFLDVSATGTVLELSTSVVISHTWRGDIELRLRHPDGTTATIFTPPGGDGRPDVIETFTVANAPELARLLNRRSEGRWTLVVIDGQPRDNGRLISWSIRMTVRG